jgi:hypothetical protein
MKRRRLCAFFLALFFGMVSMVRAADCQKTAESCVEGPETRNIGGYRSVNAKSSVARRLP